MDAAENTDREIWREREGDYYADSIFVTKEGGIGMNCGGSCVVMPIREWFKLTGFKSGPVNEQTTTYGEELRKNPGGNGDFG